MSIHPGTYVKLKTEENYEISSCRNDIYCLRNELLT